MPQNILPTEVDRQAWDKLNAELTEQARNIFGYHLVKSATDASGWDEWCGRSRGNVWIDSQPTEIRLDPGKIVIEFVGGNVVAFETSEWGGISLAEK